MIRLLIDDKELEKEVHKLITDKVKHILRNDAKIVELIEECYENEIKKKVALVSGTFIDIKEEIKNRTKKAADRVEEELIASVRKSPEFKNAVQKINEKTVESMLKHIKD